MTSVISINNEIIINITPDTILTNNVFVMVRGCIFLKNQFNLFSFMLLSKLHLSNSRLAFNIWVISVPEKPNNIDVQVIVA